MHFTAEHRETTRNDFHRLVPATFAQRGVWFLREMDEPGNLPHNHSIVLRLQGTLDVRALEQAVADVVSRHDIFRMSFDVRNGELWQVVHKDVRLDVLVHEDLRRGWSEDQDRLIARRVEEERRFRFDLTLCPLIRVVLLICGNDKNMLVITAPSLVLDDFSAGLLVKELEIGRAHV